MEKDPRYAQFSKARSETVENLEAVQYNLNRCVERGMIDADHTFYNELSDLMDEASLSKSWEELEEVITKAKILEVDVDTWMAIQGETSVSLPWPKRLHDEH